MAYRDRGACSGETTAVTVSVKNTSPEDCRGVVYIYLCGGQVMTWDVETGPVAKPFEETISLILRMNVILTLRP